jgi:hypothetical protein
MSERGSEQEQEQARKLSYHLRQARLWLEQMANEEAKASEIVEGQPALKALYDSNVAPLLARLDTLCKRYCGK